MHNTTPGSAGERLRVLRNNLGLSQPAFAETVKCSHSTISRAERSMEIDGMLLIAICCVHDVRREWLERGEEPMFAGGEEAEADYTHVPLVNARLAAGGGAEVYTERVVEELGFKTAWLHSVLRVATGNLFAFTVSGDSMSPTVEDGDLVLVDGSQGTPADGRVYALREDNALLVKRLRKAGSGGWLLVSDNEDFKPEPFPWPAPIHRAQIIGRVVWAGKKL